MNKLIVLNLMVFLLVANVSARTERGERIFACQPEFDLSTPCPQEENLVCGLGQQGPIEFKNECAACRDQRVLGYKFGACPSIKNIRVDDNSELTVSVPCADGNRPIMCTQEYSPVCGYNGEGSGRIFGNSCTACSDENIKFFKKGVCP